MAGKFGKGTTLSFNSGTTETPVITEIAELTGIGGLELSADEVDVTSHDSADNYKEFIQGLRDGGSVSLEGNFINDASQKALIAQFNSSDNKEFIITFPDALGTWTFDGFVTAFSTDAPMDDKISFSASIKVSGKPVLA